MKNLILAGAAALAFTAAPAIAQDVAVAQDGTVYVLTDVQQLSYDGWPMERQSTYDAWPYTLQEYYWTLEPMQADGWWMLNDTQRVRIYEMTPEQRVATWTTIGQQMSASETAVTARTAASANAGPRFVSREVTQTTPASYKAVSGDNVPVCTAKQQDGCINSWEKNKTGNRPLNYWPGRPASEIPGKLPVNNPNK